jgi:prepilin peptidase CpaA
MTAISANASFFVLAITSALLFYIALTDLREFKIRNDLILVVAVLFLAHALLSGRWVDLHWNIGFAAIAFALMLICYAQGLMGGGDLKLMTVALLWSGIGCVIPFLIILVIAASLHALAAKLGYVTAQRVNGRMKIAFAPAIAAGLIGIIALGCLSPR